MTRALHLKCLHQNGLLLNRTEQKQLFKKFFFRFCYKLLVLELKQLKHRNLAFFEKRKGEPGLLAKSMGTKNPSPLNTIQRYRVSSFTLKLLIPVKVSCCCWGDNTPVAIKRR